VAKFSLRRYDTQARVGVFFGILSLLSLLGFAGLILTSNMDWGEYSFSYGARRRLAMLGATAVTLGLGAAALGFGYNSAGQRRNDQQGLSWLAFFIGAGVMVICVVLFLFMRYRGDLILIMKGA
jgi:hypothetical protein